MSDNNKILEKHINQLYNHSKLQEDELAQFLEEYKALGNRGINANSMFYILNLNSMKYEYINNSCISFTGYTPDEFLGLGMKILPKIVMKQDFQLLTNDLFPKMNALTEKLTVEEKGRIIFEIYYKVKNKKTNQVNQLVEFSSYTKFDEQGAPLLSTGSYESVHELDGVMGIVRINQGEDQKILLKENITPKTYLLTKAEVKISDLLI
jgi:hypothetical protein